jgi:Fe-S-cluster-containing dehydrogenase component
MKVSRRTFLRVVGAAGTSSLVARPRRARAARTRRDPGESLALLVDTTLCEGCRACEAACSESNNLPEPAMLGQEAVFEAKRATDSKSFAVVNRYIQPEGGGKPTFVKTQCMHCVSPACASACLVNAMEKTPEGPVVYHEDRCIGCRYCMVACPFGVPKFEYDKALPYVRKCSFCIHRLREGKPPACASICPSGTLLFGKRRELLEVARTRIYQNPDRYVHHIYGEHEVGGTGVLYLSAIPFEEIGFKMDLGTTRYPDLTWGFLSAVPFVLTLWPPFLMGLYVFTKNREKAAQAETAEKKGGRDE